MTLQERSPREIRAYIDGYNDCYKKFCEELDRESIERAKAVMECMVYAVNCTSDTKGEPQWQNGQQVNLSRMDMK